MLKQTAGNSPPTDTSFFKEKGWDRLLLLVGLGTTWAASPSPDGRVHESAQPVLDLTLNSHFQPEGMGGGLQVRRKSRVPLALQHISHGVVSLLCLKCETHPSASACQSWPDAFQQCKQH